MYFVQKVPKLNIIHFTLYSILQVKPPILLKLYKKNLGIYLNIIWFLNIFLPTEKLQLKFE